MRCASLTSHSGQALQTLTPLMSASNLPWSYCLQHLMVAVFTQCESHTNIWKSARIQVGAQIQG